MFFSYNSMKSIPKIGGIFRFFATVLALCILGVTGCGGKFFIPLCQAYNTCTTTCTAGTTCTTTPGSGGAYSSFAYVANSNQGTLAGFPIPSTTFTSLTGASYTLGTPPSAMVASPKGKLLYVATSAGSVFVYVINSNGTLALGNNSQPVTSTLNPTWMSIDPSGNWLFMVSNSSPQLLVFQINPSDGVLTQTSQGTIALDTGNPTQVYITPNDKNVYVGLGLGGLDGFVFDSVNGTLSNHIHVRPLINGGSADNAIGADNNSAYLFIGEAGSGVRVLTIASNGALNEISGSPFLQQNLGSNSQLGPSSIVVDQTNTYVYVAYRTSNEIIGYTLGTGGTLTALSSSPFQTGSGPDAMALDPTGKYLLVTSLYGNPDLEVFSFDATVGGKLDSVVSTPTGTQPAGAIALSVVP